MIKFNIKTAINQKKAQDNNNNIRGIILLILSTLIIRSCGVSFFKICALSYQKKIDF